MGEGEGGVGACTCLDQHFTTRLTFGERWQALADYNRFLDEVAGFRTAADGKPVWARYEVENACRKQGGATDMRSVARAPTNAA